MATNPDTDATGSRAKLDAKIQSVGKAIDALKQQQDELSEYIAQSKGYLDAASERGGRSIKNKIRKGDNNANFKCKKPKRSPKRKPAKRFPTVAKMLKKSAKKSKAKSVRKNRTSPKSRRRASPKSRRRASPKSRRRASGKSCKRR